MRTDTSLYVIASTGRVKIAARWTKSCFSRSAVGNFIGGEKTHDSTGTTKPNLMRLIAILARAGSQQWQMPQRSQARRLNQRARSIDAIPGSIAVRVVLRTVAEREDLLHFHPSSERVYSAVVARGSARCWRRVRLRPGLAPSPTNSHRSRDLATTPRWGRSTMACSAGSQHFHGWVTTGMS